MVVGDQDALGHVDPVIAEQFRDGEAGVFFDKRSEIGWIISELFRQVGDRDGFVEMGAQPFHDRPDGGGRIVVAKVQEGTDISALCLEFRQEEIEGVAASPVAKIAVLTGQVQKLGEQNGCAFMGRQVNILRQDVCFSALGSGVRLIGRDQHGCVILGEYSGKYVGIAQQGVLVIDAVIRICDIKMRPVIGQRPIAWRKAIVGAVREEYDGVVFADIILFFILGDMQGALQDQDEHKAVDISAGVQETVFAYQVAAADIFNRIGRVINTIQHMGFVHLFY